jgi:hypothetical protein
MIAVSERAKTFHALDHAATVIGSIILLDDGIQIYKNGRPFNQQLLMTCY